MHLSYLSMTCLFAVSLNAAVGHAITISSGSHRFFFSDYSEADQLTPPPEHKRLIGSLRPSFYWIALETQTTDPKDQSILDPSGIVLATVTKTYYTQLRMEGTGKLLDGRLVNFASRISLPDGSSEVRWRICGPEAPFGYGYEDRLLIPFKTVAVDPTVIPLDRKIYIPDARGTILPDGSIHDGYFEALDIGTLIKEKKIDIFTSFGDQSIFFRRNGMQTGKFVDVFLVE